MSEALLRVEDLNVYYGMIQALKGISFEVNRGEIVSLIGANGAGKTTTLHTITGLLHPKVGRVLYKDQDITRVPAHKIVGMGMVHVPEGRRIFQGLSVYDNLLLGSYSRKDKAEIVKKAFTGPVTPQVPASILQMHSDVILVADEAAASLL